MRDFAYAYFGWLGAPLSRLLRSAEADLDSAYMRVHPEVYFSLIIMMAIGAGGAALLVTFVWALGLLPFSNLLPLRGWILPILIIVAPLSVLLAGFLYPKGSSSNRTNGLKTEIPYASMYISVMASGGLSPYESLLRLRGLDLLPNMSKEVERIETITYATGVDPVTAMEVASKQVNIPDYNELLLGYASTLRSGGDTLHYLYNRTKNMFSGLSIRMKAMGEHMGMLMEAYTIIGILGVMGIFLIFVIGISLPMAGASISPEQFFFFSFVFMPFVAFVFIYAADSAQISYPISNWVTYIYAGVFIVLGCLLATQLVLPFFSESFLVFPEARTFMVTLRIILGMEEGMEAPLGLGLVLIAVSLPCGMLDYLIVEKDHGIQDGVVRFLRDLVETRKSGLSPEKCIDALSKRNYKAFSPLLKTMAMKLNWGYPIRQIYGEFRGKVKNWLALVNVYLLIDTLDVGGGSVESLEALADFAESSKRLEEERIALLAPLNVVPVIGAALLTGSTVLFLSFFAKSNMGVPIQTVELYKTLLTPLALHSFTLGLVTGKITSGRVSAGFRHAIILILISLLGIMAAGRINVGGMFSS